MRIFFEIDNLINYIEDVYASQDKNTFPLLDYVLQQQELYINCVIPYEKQNGTDQTSHKEFVVDNFEYSRRCDSRSPEHPLLKILRERLKDKYDEFKPKFDIWANMQYSSKSKKWEDIRDIFNKEINTLEDKFKKLNTISFLGTEESQIESKYSSGSEFSTLKSILCIDEDYYPTKTYYTRELKTWSPISKNSIRSTEIIIVDPYLFDTNINKYRYNVFELISAICRYNVPEINVIIFANYNYRYDVIMQVQEGTSIVNSIKESMKGKIKNITFVCPKARMNSNRKGENLLDNIHDRYIITNHRLVVSGHSFSQYFSCNREDSYDFTARGSMWMSINSLSDGNNESITIEAIKYLQEQIISKCKENDIIGDMKSNIFQFKCNKVLFEDYYSSDEYIQCYEGLKRVADKDYKIIYKWNNGLFKFDNIKDGEIIKIIKNSVIPNKSGNPYFKAKLYKIS